MKNGKIKNLDELAKVLSDHRSGKKKIVLCHGVFDLLHLGHIRYFEQARKLGDVLAVTVTPDRFVNKGPLRPAFHEDHRAEAIAALSCVDYVAINHWPLAVETIQRLRPHFYVKGPDYKNTKKDHTGGIIKEEQAVKSVGGKLVFTDEVTFSASSLIKRYLPMFPEEVTRYLEGFSKRFCIDDVIGALDRAKKLKVLVLGESIIDEYHYCEAIGKSSKEPMLALKHLSAEKFAGGILAVGNHVANFCGETGLISFLGDRGSEKAFIQTHLNKKIRQTFLIRQNSPTIIKRRFIDNYFFTKMFEVYEMNDDAMDAGDNRLFCQTLERELPKYDVVIVVDFGHGMISKEAVQILCRKARFLAVNAQSNAGNLGYHTVSRYSRADYLCVAEGEMRLEARDRRGDLKTIVREVSKKLKCPKVIVTRGKYGCLCFDQKEGFYEVPPLAAQVVDRMGAGDAFLSLTSLAVVQGAPMELVGFIGNAVGAEAVATVGHRSAIQKAPLFKHIESLLK